MKKKILSLLFAATMITLSASSQTIKDNIDKLAKDKNTKERAAKADVFIQKKNILDSTEIKTAPQKVIVKTPAVKQKYKASKYKKKTKKNLSRPE
jgi:tryptophanyl-tRNA synthetase